MPEQLTLTDDMCQVQFVAEDGRSSRLYDFAALELDPRLQQWLAGAFARATGPSSGIKRLTGANGLWATLSWFGRHLAASENPPRRPAEVTPAHIAAAWLVMTPLSRKANVERLRTIFRADRELPDSTRAAILHGRLPEYESKVQPYSMEEYQVLMTAVRHDVRMARDRIAEGRALLARYRAGELGRAGRYNQQEKVGRALDLLDRTGSLPREEAAYVYKGQERSGVPAWIQACGGTRRLYAMLTLTRLETMAFALLLCDLTAENFGTVCQWPAPHFRPDGGLGSSALALVDATKPRRGPSREAMVSALEDLPPSLGDVLVPGDDKHLFRSPLRAYLLLLDLTELARRYSGGSLAFCYPDPGSLHGTRWIEGTNPKYLQDWARAHGFPPERRDKPGAAGVRAPRPDGGKPSVNVFRLRRFALERRGRPVAHSAETFRDRYLRSSTTAQAESRAVMREALEVEVAKARTAGQVAVLTADVLDLARRDLHRAAQKAHLDEDTLSALISGTNDTVLVGCTNTNESPFTERGKPCGASFLSDCMRCENARALPRHLPVQVEVHERLAALRANVGPGVWEALHAEPFGRLTDLLRAYTPGEIADARGRVTAAVRNLVDDLMAGRLDLR